MDTSGATAFKLPIIANATERAAVTIRALRGSPFLDIFANGPKKGTAPSPAIACPEQRFTRIKILLTTNALLR